MKFILKVFDIFTFREKKNCVVLLFCMFLGGLFEAVGISAIFPLISILGDSNFLEKHEWIKKNIYTYCGDLSHIQFIFLFIGVLIIWYIGKIYYVIWLTKKQIYFITQKQIIVSKQLMMYYLKKSYLEHLEKNSAILLRNLQLSMNDVFSKMFLYLLLLITESAVAFTIWLMIVYIDPFIATIVFGAFGILIYSIIQIMQKKLLLQGDIQNQCAANFAKWLNQGLGAIKETKVLCKEKFFWQEFSQAYERYGRSQYFYNIILQIPKFFIEVCVILGLLLVILIKLILGALPNEIIPLLGVLALAAFRLMPCANRIVLCWGTVKYYFPAFLALYEDFMAVKEQDLNQKKFCVNVKRKKIEFSHEIIIDSLCFFYPKNLNEVLKSISFKIPKGSFVGIVGQSGAGKTTFIDILLGLLEPTSGTILVDGQDIFRNIRGWQANLAYVPQSIYLIDGSIRENIAFGETPEEIDDAKVERALQMAELYDFVCSLPEGLETSVGERGVKLSGGQRQRIGVARALYQEPEVLILDEATSALDSETEKNITDTILKLKGEVTIIAIAHRMSTLEHCDFKVKFENGRAQIVESDVDGMTPCCAK